MKERPILFSAPMVRAILEGRKTQTRRVWKKQPYLSRCSPPNFEDTQVGDLFICPDLFPTETDRGNVIAECTSTGSYHYMGSWAFIEKHGPKAYGVPGDRLWVKETHIRRESRAIYFADLDPVEAAGVGGMYGGWKPSIFMFRKHSRITLEITDVRVQRIQDISEEDARAEGIHQVLEPNTFELEEPYKSTIHKRRFSHVWDFINAKRGFGWDVNPWCWCISFKPAEV